jgi:phage-related protein
VVAVALNIGELVGFIRADDRGMRRGLNDAELRMRGFQRDTEGRLRRLDGTFATTGELLAAGIREGTDEGRRFTFQLGRLAGAGRGLLGVAASIGGIAAKLGVAVPLAAGLAGAVGSIAPAAAVAVTALVAVQLASKAIKLGMVGVGDAVKAAMDPSNPEAFAEALEKLSPEAKAFAKQVKAMQPEFKALQQSVQDKMFKDWSKSLKEAGRSVLPVLRKGLEGAATSVNRMGHGVASAAQEMAENGTLGRALSSANLGLSNLTRAPGQLVKGLGQIAAAAGPSFERLTGAAGGALDKLSDRLTKAFESGAMQKAIEQAISLIGDLAEIAGNVFSTIGSIFSAAEASGGGFIGVLKTITQALEDAFASPEVQAGLRAIFETMAEVAKVVAPLLIEVMKAVAPVFVALGPPIQTLVRALGAALQPVIKALAPVLKVAAEAFGKLIEAAAPLLEVAGELIAALLPALTPLFAALVRVFESLAPVIKTVADILSRTLTPIFEKLTPIIEPLAELLADQLVFWLEFLGDLLVELAPSLEKMAVAFADLMVALAPVIEAFAKLSAKLLEKLAPYLPKIIELVGKLAAGLAYVLGSNITNVLIPALEILTKLLSGDFSGALDSAKKMAADMAGKVAQTFREMPRKAWSALKDLGSKLKARMTEAGVNMVAEMRRRIGMVVDHVKSIPGRAQSALGRAGIALFKSGRALISGFISGILSKVGEVASAASSVVSRARDFFPFSPAKEGPFSGKGWTLYSGQSIGDAMAAGLASRGGAVRSAAAGLLGAANDAMASMPVPVPMGGGGVPAWAQDAQFRGAPQGGGVQTVRIVVDGPEAMTRLIRKIVQTDGRGSVQTAFGK